MSLPSLTRYAWLSIGASILIIGAKFAAYRLTGSVGYLSDALESVVNLAAAGFALFALWVAVRPPDAEHAYGHTKIEYFAAGVEGVLIAVASTIIASQAIRRLASPQPLEQLGLGTLFSAAAAAINFVVARVLLRAGRQHHSATLIADAEHLLTDVWTTIGVIVGVIAVGLTGWLWLDPVIALIVAGQILWTGYRLIRKAVNGLMDVSASQEDVDAVVEVLETYRNRPIAYHALRTRQAGAQTFVSVHVQVPGAWSVQQGHEVLEEIEREIRRRVYNASVMTHLEPIEDPVSWEDVALLRPDDEDAATEAVSTSVEDA